MSFSKWLGVSRTFEAHETEHRQYPVSIWRIATIRYDKSVEKRDLSSEQTRTGTSRPDIELTASHSHKYGQSAPIECRSRRSLMTPTWVSTWTYRIIVNGALQHRTAQAFRGYRYTVGIVLQATAYVGWISICSATRTDVSASIVVIHTPSEESRTSTHAP